MFILFLILLEICFILPNKINKVPKTFKNALRNQKPQKCKLCPKKVFMCVLETMKHTCILKTIISIIQNKYANASKSN